MNKTKQLEIKTSETLDKLLDEIVDLDWDYINIDDPLNTLREKADFIDSIYLDNYDVVYEKIHLENGIKLGLTAASKNCPIYAVSGLNYLDETFYFIDNLSNITSFLKSILDSLKKEVLQTQKLEGEKEVPIIIETIKNTEQKLKELKKTLKQKSKNKVKLSKSK